MHYTILFDRPIVWPSIYLITLTFDSKQTFRPVYLIIEMIENERNIEMGRENIEMDLKYVEKDFCLSGDISAAIYPTERYNLPNCIRFLFRIHFCADFSGFKKSYLVKMKKR